MTLANQLLVAAPALLDPNFARSVVYLLEHSGDDGALGVVINRPGVVPVDELLDGWGELVASPDAVFVGGPVDLDTAFAIGRGRSSSPIHEHLFLRDLVGAARLLHADSAPSELRVDLVELRVFLGYAGWGPGQLEVELSEQAWFVVDPHEDDLFSPQPDELWRSVLARQPGTLGWLGHFPDDLLTN